MITNMAGVGKTVLAAILAQRVAPPDKIFWHSFYEAEDGEIRFFAGSHKNGTLKHIIETEDGPCEPHLPTNEWKLEDTVPVPAKRGDVVIFCYYTGHGSYINQTNQPRRLVRIGYQNPHNKQEYGHSLGSPGIMVYGYREREEGQEMLKTT